MTASTQESIFNSGFAMAESLVGAMIKGAPGVIKGGNALSIFALSYASAYQSIASDNVKKYSPGQIMAAATMSALLDAVFVGGVSWGSAAALLALGAIDAPVGVLAVGVIGAGIATGLSSSNANYEAQKNALIDKVISSTSNFDALLNSYNNPSASALQSNAPSGITVGVTQNEQSQVISETTVGANNQPTSIATTTANSNGITQNITGYSNGQACSQQTINCSNTGGITATISGSGVAIDFSDMAITITAGSSVTLTGTGNTVNSTNSQVTLGDDASATINGSGNTITVGKDASVTVNSGTGSNAIEYANGKTLTVTGRSTVSSGPDGSLTIGQDFNTDGTIDQTTTTTQLAPDVIQTQTQDSAGKTTDTITVGNTSFNLDDPAQRDDAEYQLSQLHQNGILSDGYWQDFTQSTANHILNTDTFSPPSQPGGNDFGIDFSDPIGAFYDSQSTTYDQATSIASHTGVLVNSQGGRITLSQLQALDSNGDGTLTMSESSSLRLLTDQNENGHLDAGELKSVDRNITSQDWTFYTQGNSQMASAPSAKPAMRTQEASTPIDLTHIAPNSNYRALRDSDNRYYVNDNNWIDFAPGQIKINNSNRNTLIGTDGDDSFDATSISKYPQWINDAFLNQLKFGGGKCGLAANENDYCLVA